MIDRVVRVRALPRAGETIAARSAATFAGGKGANQAAAAAKCGARVRMVGRTGEDGRFIVDALREAGVRTSAIAVDDPAAGAATVMVADGGENAIVIATESNARLERGAIEAFLRRARAGEIALFQNECAHLVEGIAFAASRALRVWLNAAPADASLRALRFEKLTGLIVNETEAEALTGEADPARALELLATRMPGGTVVVTLGARGAIAANGARRVAHRGFVVEAVDTVGCGDAFVGAFLVALAEKGDLAIALARGNAAGALAAMRAGAMPSLPTRTEVDAAAALPERSVLSRRATIDVAGALPSMCVRCGYLLTGNGEAAACPECGTPVRRLTFRGRWADARVRARIATGATWMAVAAASPAAIFLLIEVGSLVLDRAQQTVVRPYLNACAAALVLVHVVGWGIASVALARGANDLRMVRAGVAMSIARAALVVYLVALLTLSIRHGAWFPISGGVGLAMLAVLDAALAFLMLVVPRRGGLQRPTGAVPTARVVVPAVLLLAAGGLVQRVPPAHDMSSVLVGIALWLVAWLGIVAEFRAIARRIRRQEVE